ncbi:helix-turn-helix domain-containing protein [Jatrophihabitans endophyticus]|uniref:helix-turn-helix domain-containing protein n=1 Tax=Jatrophihabitans endophyticus TaxID=1206085 RepID=UPI0011612E52|nr:helix-turn-helix domain-containing protein [Jatrophihabitans endophyticus]
MGESGLRGDPGADLRADPRVAAAPHATRHDAGPAAGPAERLWGRLGASMRAMRTAAGLSLRQVESETGTGRGTLSQIETGKARPNRAVVEWYDTVLGADGLLLSVFAEARGAYATAGHRDARRRAVPGDAMVVTDPALPHGLLLDPGAVVAAAWTLHNIGVVPWSGRRLVRVGAHAAPGLPASARDAPVPACGPGERVRVEVAIRLPVLPGSFAAYWHLGDEAGRDCTPAGAELPCVLLVVAAGLRA